MNDNNYTKGNFTSFSHERQLVLPLDFEILLPEDSPVRLLDDMLERLDYTELDRLYSPYGRKSKLPPRDMLKIIIYAMLEGTYSLRDIQHKCEVNIEYMWLLQGRPAPSHMAIGRFFKRVPVEVREDLFAQIVHAIGEIDALPLQEVYIDGTKLEANANRYTFVWKKSVVKNRAKLMDKIRALQDRCSSEGYGGADTSIEGLTQLLEQECEKQGVQMVSGKGHHKQPLQKLVEESRSYRDKLQEYDQKLAILDDRNSYSKTDPTATFMRMKEDHMKNGQLKPAYNLQIAAESEYVVAAKLFPNPTDTRTLCPFLRHIEHLLGHKPKYVVADAGYGSEQNLDWLKQNDQLSVIKDRDYEIRKTRKYQKKIGLAANMQYNEEADTYTCAKGRTLTFQYVSHCKRADGYIQEGRVYQCEKCSYCGFRSQCQPSRNGTKPKQNKRLVVYRKYQDLQKENSQRFLSPEGIRMRVNRSIQVEGTFGQIKQDYRYRRFLRRGADDVYKELLAVLMGFNIRKLYSRMTEGRIGRRFLTEEVAS